MTVNDTLNVIKDRLTRASKEIVLKVQELQDRLAEGTVDQDLLNSVADLAKVLDDIVPDEALPETGEGATGEGGSEEPTGAVEAETEEL